MLLVVIIISSGQV